MAKWIEFLEQNHTTRKTKTFIVRNKETGVVKWFGSFRQYSFFPNPETVFEKTCLRDISNFMEELMNERKNERNKIFNEASL